MAKRWEYNKLLLTPAEGVDEQFKLVLFSDELRLAEFVVCRHHRHGQQETMVDLTIFASVDRLSLEQVYEHLKRVCGVQSHHCDLLRSIKSHLVKGSNNLAWEIIKELLEDDVVFVNDGSGDITYTNAPIDEEDRAELEERLRDAFDDKTEWSN